MRDRRPRDVRMDVVCEHREIAPEAVGIAMPQAGFILVLNIMGPEPLPGAVLGGVHERRADRQLSYAVFPADLIDQADHFLTDLRQLVRGFRDRLRGLGWGLAGIGGLAVHLDAALVVDVEAHSLPDVPELHIVVAQDIVDKAAVIWIF